MMTQLLPISDDQFDKGTIRHITMLTKARSLEELDKIYPFHRIIVRHSYKMDMPRLASKMKKHYMDTYIKLKKKNNASVS